MKKDSVLMVKIKISMVLLGLVPIVLVGAILYHSFRLPRNIDEVMFDICGGNPSNNHFFRALDKKVENPLAAVPSEKIIYSDDITLKVESLQIMEPEQYGLIGFTVQNASGKKFLLEYAHVEYCLHEEWYCIYSQSYVNSCDKKFCEIIIHDLEYNIKEAEVLNLGTTDCFEIVTAYDARINKANRNFEFKMADGKHRLVLCLWELGEPRENSIPYGYLCAEFEVKNNKLLS